MRRWGSRAFRRRIDGQSAGAPDRLWPPASLSGWLLLIGAYILLGIVATGCFLAAFVVFSGGRVPEFVPEWLGWVGWGFAGLLAVLIVAGWGFRLLRPERYRAMEQDNEQRRSRR